MATKSKPQADKIWADVIELRMRGAEWDSLEIDEVARGYGFNGTESMRTHIRRYSNDYKQYQQSVRESRQRPPEYTYVDGLETGIPIFDGWLNVSGDFGVIGDVHLPSPNWRFLDTYLQVCEQELPTPRQLLIVGDFTSNDKDSYYPHLVPPVTRQLEFQMSKNLIDKLLEVFDHIYMTPGNHFHRLMKAMDGDMTMSDYKGLLTRQPEKMTLSIYDFINIESGGVEWVATHQRNYSKIKLRVADDLAQKYRKNIITFHQHHTAMGFDKFGHQVIIDCGGFHNSLGMAYVQLVPNTSPRMNNGGVILKNGRAELITPDKRWTDFSRWDIDYE